MAEKAGGTWVARPRSASSARARGGRPRAGRDRASAAPARPALDRRASSSVVLPRRACPSRRRARSSPRTPCPAAVSQGTSFVASPTATTSTPVAIGSSVPACPTSRVPSARRTAPTTSWLVGPRGLSTTRTPPRAPTAHRSPEPDRPSLADGPVEHRLDRRRAPARRGARRGSRRSPASGPCSSRSIGSPKKIFHFVGAGNEPERAEQRERRRHGDVRDAERPREVLDAREHRVRLLGADDGDGHDGRARPQARA